MTVAKFEALNELAKFPILWHSEYVDINNVSSPDFPYSHINQKKFKEIYKTDLKGIHNDIPKGQITKHRQYYKDICKQFAGARF